MSAAPVGSRREPIAASSGGSKGTIDGLRTLTDILRRGDLRYCVLHGSRPARRNHRSDIDIALAASNLRQMEEVLRRSGDAQPIQLFQHETSCYYFVLVVRCGETPHLLTLDVATDYRRDGVVFFTEQQLLEHRRHDNGVWTASPGTEFAYLLVKKILKKTLPEHQKARIHTLFGSLGRDAHVIVYGLMGARWGSRVAGWLAGPDWPTFESHLPALKKVLRWEIVRRHPLNPVQYWLPELRRRWRRWCHPTGLCVGVLGPDGAGKSTLIAQLVQELSGAFRHTEVYHFRPNLMRGKVPCGPVTDPHGRKPRPGWLSLFKLVHYAFGYVVGYILQVRPRLACSSLLVFDRYYHDLLVDPLRYRYGGSMRLVRLIQRFIPRPDMWFILDVPEDELWRRKQEAPETELRRQREGYLRLGRELQGAVLLDGSLAAEEVVRRARDALLAHLQHRYEARRSLWFGYRQDGQGQA